MGSLELPTSIRSAGAEGGTALRENIMRRIVLPAVLLGLIAFPAIASEQIVARINLSKERMVVYVDGAAR